MKNFRIVAILTESCNLACKYCYVDHLNKNKMSNIVLDGIINIAKEKLENDYNVSIDLFGGEALLAWDEIKYCINKCEILNNQNDKKITLVIFTNAILLSEEILNYTKSYKFVCYNFSLDGCEKSHDEARIYPDGRGSYKDVIKGLELYANIYKRPINQVCGKIIVSPQNLKYLMDTAKEAMINGKIRLSLGLNRGDVWDDNSLKLYEEKMTELAEFYIKNIDAPLWYDIFAIPIIDSEFSKKSFCSAGKNTIGISPNGDIYPCQRFYNNRSNYKMGDVFTGIDKESIAYSFFNNYTLDNFLKCKNCDTFNKNCLGQCIAAMHEAGNILNPIDSVCKIHKINIKLAKKIDEELKNNKNYQKTLDINHYGG